MAFCSKCGASINEGVSFCGRCGTPVQPGAGVGSVAPPPPPPPNYPPPGFGGPAPNLVTRVTNILTKPQQEWEVIAGESATIAGLYTGYVIILAAIPWVASFLKMSFIESLLFRVPMFTGLIAAVLGYALGLAGLYVSAFVIDKLAPNFQSRSELIQAFKLVVYASTASWVAGAFNIIPFVGWLLALIGSLYGIYLFYLGLPVMMKTPQDKVVIYMIVCAVIIFVIYIVIAMIVGGITAAALIGRGMVG